MKYIQGKKDVYDFNPMSLNIGNKYIDGYEAIGDVTRKRNKDLEIAGVFMPNTTKCAWEKMFKQIESNENFSSRNRINRVTSASKLYPNSMRET